MTFNLIDISLGLILAISVFFSRGLNVIKELIKLLGAILATFVCLHYYIVLGHFFKVKEIISQPLNYLMAFILLAAVVVFIFTFIAEGWVILLKLELPEWLNRSGSWIISIIRTYLIFGIIYVGLLISGGDIEKQTRESGSSAFIGQISVGVYAWLFDHCIKIILPDEVFRQDVVDFVLINPEDKDKKDKEISENKI